MLKGISLPNRHVLDIMSTSKFEFHLTGSRYFGNATEYSDWDFFIFHNANGIITFLKDLGFTKLSNLSEELVYKDYNLAEVWRYQNGEIQIDVQLVVSVQKKRVAQAIIKRFNLLNIAYIDNLKHYHIWNRVYDAIQEGEL